MSLQSVNPNDVFSRLTPEQRQRMTKDHRLKVKTLAYRLRGALVQTGILIAWIIVIQAIALFFFTRGFLLSRPVLESHSECTVLPPFLQDSAQNSLQQLQHVYQFNKNDSAPKTLFQERGCWGQKSFEKAVILVIDALRFDFTVPGPETPAQYLNALPFMYDTAVSSPENALLLKFIADPPTTTLQRLKGLTTGSLPTFIDAGSNFAGTEILEDSWVAQLANLTDNAIAFTGDDTWMSLFAPLFNQDLASPYESLNVLDLHTVDNGVIQHIFPFIQSPALSEKWKVAIGHTLGVDHAGHRYGPAHPAMREKLQQMNDVIKRLTEAIDDDTLLIVFGDHGMDPRGDHGGESLPELEAALWMYSKKPAFGRLPDPNGTVYNDDNYGKNYRSVQQIDLVPTLSLLLGLPIPFNNLGFPIAEPFLSPTSNTSALARAQLLTAAQIHRYARADGSLSKIAEVSDLWEYVVSSISESSGKSPQDVIDATRAYHDFVLNEYHTLWVQFDLTSMAIGIGFMVVSIIIAYTYARALPTEMEQMIGPLLKVINTSAGVVGMVFSLSSRLATRIGIAPKFFQSSTNGVLFGVAFGASLGFLSGFSVAFYSLGNLKTIFSLFILPKSSSAIFALVLTISHAILFASNSYTVWEDRVLLFLLASLGFYFLVLTLRGKKKSKTGILEQAASIAASGNSSDNSDSESPKINSNNASRTSSRSRSISPVKTPLSVGADQEKEKRKVMALYFSVTFLIVLRMAAYSGVCREEQGPECKTTFYLNNNSTVSSFLSVGLLGFASLYLPTVIASFYETSASLNNTATVWIAYGLRVIMIFITIYWGLDTLEARNFFEDPSVLDAVKAVKVTTARIILGIVLLAANYAWWQNSLCIKLEVSRESVAEKSKKQQASEYTPTQARILGYSNVYGSMIMLAVLNIFAATLVVSKPMAGVTLSILIFQLFTLLELFDIHIDRLYFSALGPVALGLLGSFHFFTTGHQATIPSVQWDVAYIPSSTIIFPFTHLALILNTFAPQIIVSLAVPLLLLWKIPPSKTPTTLLQLVSKSGITLILYQATITLSTMVFALHFRRHLMVWKIFAPRFMLAGMALGVVDVCVFLGVVVFGGRAITFINKIFNT
ncbi:uncharacterized protein SAPINGB_P001835 [Magnusiomyces paraingens]|uniref:Uncharacterized protein n=1 Tax=Magnusiomyces paraingens TaxID=2606893 RepID=A0A5E8BIH5_9ASCO|nr:uncharacterized protein SAPINGB_P001835 [Saprochaete ingens]VVT48553.1 unnamed protein product [Saprochaete ingens]